MVSRYISLLLFAFVCLTAWGCGDDENDFLVSNGSSSTFAVTSSTGNLLFSFVTAQSALLPAPSAELVFHFYSTAPDSSDREAADPLLESSQPLAPNMIVSDVPIEARYVRISVYSASGQPLMVLTDEVSVRAGLSTPVDLSDARTETVEVTHFQILPRQARLEVAESLQLQVVLGFSNGDVAALTPEQISRRVDFEADSEGLVQVDSQGRVTALAPGVVTITATDRDYGSSLARFTVNSHGSD